MIENLLNPSKYPDKPDNVKLVQTHISYVFISRNLVYKIKKPVNFGFLDFTSLEKRKYFCNREIILNSRLSPDIYIKTVPVLKTNNDYFYDGENGEIVDYAVVMKRIDEQFLVKNLLKQDKIKTNDFKVIAEHLFKFHNKYPASIETAKENSSIEMLKFTTDENFSQTEQYIGITIAESGFKNLKSYTNDFYIKNKELLNKRIADSKIKECHGDLHLEHVGIKDNKAFFLDCIEFNERFRIIDVANEIAFLAMDLDYNGYKDFSKDFIDFYISISNDTEIITLINFYKIYRAYVRGKVTSFLIDDKNIPENQKKAIISTAKNYFTLAESYLEES